MRWKCQSEYKRLRTLSLLAEIDLQNGETIPMVSETHSSKDYIEFLKLLDSKYPKNDKTDASRNLRKIKRRIKATHPFVF